MDIGSVNHQRSRLTKGINGSNGIKLRMGHLNTVESVLTVNIIKIC